MKSHTAARIETASVFAKAIQEFDRTKPVWILGHNDADDLSATALFARAFGEAGWAVRTRIVGRGETPWSDAMRAELANEPADWNAFITGLGFGPEATVPATAVPETVA